MRFSKETLPFIARASRQKRPDWLDKNREDYDQLLREPLHHLARQLKAQLSSLAPSYHFPQKGLGRLKRPAHRASEGGGLYKSWVTYSASRPSGSRFEHNPSLFFMLNPEDEDGDEVLVAGGLYMPSSRQVRAIREAIAQDASPFERLFASKAFSSRFPEGFSKERSSSRVPRGFDPDHPKMDWIRLQGFFVWRSYSKRDFTSAQFANQVAHDFTQVLRLNELLDLATQGRLAQSAPAPKKVKSQKLAERIEELSAPARPMDF